MDVIPTGIDTDKYVPRTNGPHSHRTIGWIGTTANLKYLYSVEGALAKVMASQPDAKIRIISDGVPKFRFLDSNRCQIVRWSEHTEVQSLRDLDIGIMPLDDSPWARGKCSFKMLQYMALGLPVVVSPVGMNAEVLSLGNVGFAATTEAEWVDALTALLESRALCEEMGATGRKIVETFFSVNALAGRLATCLNAA